jgi:hypothetical protein
MEKKCRMCLEFKQVSNFKKHKETRDRLSNYCKICSNAKQREYRAVNRNICSTNYEKTHTGFLMRLYRNMQSRTSGVQKLKKHLYAGKGLLSRAEFYKWANGCVEFHEMFCKWEKNDYLRTLTPTVDRINSDEGYSIENMQWLTHSENSRRGSLNRWNKSKLL